MCLHAGLLRKGPRVAAGGGGSELPKLEVDGAAMRKTDERGRAYFGDVGIGEGSGRVAPDENTGANRQGGAMELILVAEVAGLGDADAKCVLIGRYSYRQKDRCAVKLHSKLRDHLLSLESCPCPRCAAEVAMTFHFSSPRTCSCQRM